MIGFSDLGPRKCDQPMIADAVSGWFRKVFGIEETSVAW